MDLRRHWPELDRLCRHAQRLPDLVLWGFGSMLRTDRHRDLDVLVVYTTLADVTALRGAHPWEVNLPPIDLIAMTPDEERDYRFIETTGAIRL